MHLGLNGKKQYNCWIKLDGINLISRYMKYIPSMIIAMIMALPILCVIGYALAVDTAVWMRLWETRIFHLFINTSLLALTVTIGTILLGGLLAFLVERTDMPFRRAMKPLLVAPLITPCYIIAICYINFFGIKGLGEKLFSQFGLTVNFPSIYGFWGAAAVLILGTFPYVYTIVGASLNLLDPSFSEAARCLGIGRFQRMKRITLPLLFPSFSAGAILVMLYVLSDFGVVSLLRYQTFVNTIYEQMSGRYDYSTAAALSTLLIGITLLIFLLQEIMTQKKQYSSLMRKSQNSSLIQLQHFRIPALLFCLFILFIALIIPLGVLIYWLFQSARFSENLSHWNISFQELIQSGWNSLSIAAMAATAAVAFALPISYWVVRRPESVLGKILSWISQSGVALPGVLTALGITLVLSKIAPQWSFSIFALLFAFIVHFFAQSFQTTQAGLKQISKKMEESARLLGYSPMGTFWKVTRPLLTPSLLTAWVLVFLSTMRELPASLLLRPAGFDPLTVKVWIAASEGFYEQAAAPALMIILLSLPLVIIINNSWGVFQET